MKITLNSRENKPLDNPQMVMKKKLTLGSPQNDPLLLPVAVEPKLPIVRPSTDINVNVRKFEKPESKQKKKLTLPSFNFQLAEPMNTTFSVKPVPTTDNEKINVFIEAFANTYKEFFNQVRNFSYSEDGLSIPQQDKIFMETVIDNKKVQQFITTNEHQEEYVEQQIGFTWYKAQVLKQQHEVIDFDVDKSIIYEFTLKFTPALTLKPHEKLSDKMLRDFLELSKLFRDDEKALIQFGFQPSENDWYKEGNVQLKDLPTKIKKSEYSTNKMGYSAFDCCLRLIVQSNDKIRLETISRGLVSTLKRLEHDNELIAKQVKPKRAKQFYKRKVLGRKVDVPLSFRKRFILTNKEIAHFIVLPNRTLQKDYHLEVDEKGVTTVHKNFLSGKGLWLGDVTVKGNNKQFRIPTEELDQLCGTYAFVGQPRSGKDMSCSRFIIELAKRGHGAVIGDAIDESGRGMADIIKQNLPEDKVIDIDLADFNNPVYFGLDDVVDAIGVTGVDVVANDLVGILELDKNYSSKQLARLVAKACKCNLFEMFSFLKSDKYARRIQKRVLDEGNELLHLQLEMEYFQTTIQANVRGAVINRLDELLSMSIMKNLFAARPNPKFNLQKFIEQNKVVLIRMKKDGGLGEQGVKVMMNLLLLKVSWLKKIKQTDNVTFLVFNEFHQYATETFNETLSSLILESPKYRLGINLIFHTPNKIDRKLYECIQSGAKGLFLFKNGNLGIFRDMYERIKPLDVEACLKIKRHECLYLSNIEDSEPFFIQMHPTDKFDTNYKSVKQTSIYGTKASIVNKDIYETEKWMYEPEPKPEENEEKSEEKPKKSKKTKKN
ncbi:nucleoside triphosphate hydrolase [Bacillus phage Staley]|uniref:Nucleoside triphosphate hydrolase n=1 Tax=Bacillus phage Staley TaxID=1406792 RepID=U5PYA8_9CAUD|nr:nucleoside triphosphate hydrolase [Bacillus phage Staley]AGY48781.1 nucleoside triphosphate hydrolase [Bacillus phage Staley]